MNLAAALRVRAGALVTFTGAGGKTTAMLRLGRELAASGLSVLATTTTRLGRNQLDLFPAQLIDPRPSEIAGALAAHRFVVAASALTDDKALGFTPAQLDRFRELADVVLVEGDGSRGLAIKAPGPNEPVIPPETSHVVTLAHLAALGHPLGPEIAHRPDLVARLTGLRLGDAITPNALARLLLHPGGPARGAPPSAECYILLNGAEAVAAPALAHHLSAAPALTAVLLGQLSNASPIQASYGKTAVIILAAGAARRFGSPKQLTDWRGQPLLRHVVSLALAAPAQQIIVVLGAYAERIAPTLAGLPVTLVHNPAWNEGQSTSRQAGLRACAPGTQAALFVLGDQPYLPAELLQRLIETHRRTLAPIVSPRAGDQRGHPVLFDRRCFPEFNALTGDVGGRILFERHNKHVEWVDASEEILHDIDQPSDLDLLRDKESS